MASAGTDIDDIRRQMAQVRREMHEDVRDVVASAEAVTDWHRYLRDYPWVALVGAFAIGYFIVPKRRVVAPPQVVTVSAPSLEAVERAETPEKRSSSGLLGAAWGMLVPIAIRAAQGYAIQYLEHWIAGQHLLGGQPPEPSPTQPRGSRVAE